MPKIPNDEYQAWTLVYTAVIGLITLGTSIHHGTPSQIGVKKIDERAAELADRIIERWKEKRVI